MAIIKKKILGTGHPAEYWALTELTQITPHIDSNETEVVGSYRLWATKKAREDGFGPSDRIRRIRAMVPGLDPRLSEIETAMDDELLRGPVVAVAPVREVVAQPAVKAARANAGDPGNGIPPTPAVEARPAVKAVKAVERVRGIKGGALHGGKRA